MQGKLSQTSQHTEYIGLHLASSHSDVDYNNDEEGLTAAAKALPCMARRLSIRSFERSSMASYSSCRDFQYQ